MLGLQEKAKCFGYPIPQYFWFMLSGFLCDCAQAIIDYLLYSIYIWDWERTTVCWLVSYSISIFIRHSSHRMLVFGEYEGTYLSSLGRTYLTYSSSIVLSTIANHTLVDYVQFSHYQAWFSTMCWIGIYNYVLLKANWGRGGVKNKYLDTNSNNNIGISSNSNTTNDEEQHLELLSQSSDKEGSA